MLVVGLLAFALLAGGAAGDNGKGDHGSPANGQAGYHFLVFDAVSGTSDRMIITGDGSFNAHRAHGWSCMPRFSRPVSRRSGT